MQKKAERSGDIVGINKLRSKNKFRISQLVHREQPSYPTRPITLVVASAPGGTADIYGRIIADQMSAILGQKIVPDNVPGSGGIIGTARVARAEPDGYTVLIHQTGIAIAPALMPDLQVDVRKALTVVGLINESYELLIGLKAAVHRELKRKHVTLSVLWDEYIERNPQGLRPRPNGARNQEPSARTVRHRGLARPDQPGRGTAARGTGVTPPAPHAAPQAGPS